MPPGREDLEGEGMKSRLQPRGGESRISQFRVTHRAGQASVWGSDGVQKIPLLRDKKKVKLPEWGEGIRHGEVIEGRSILPERHTFGRS